MSAWLNDIWKAGQANKGGVVRRAVGDVHRFSSQSELIREARRRGYHVIEAGDQYIVLCNEGSLVIHC